MEKPALVLGMEIIQLLDRLANGLAVGNHRVTDVGLDLELATHTINQREYSRFAGRGDEPYPFADDCYGTRFQP